MTNPVRQVYRLHTLNNWLAVVAILLASVTASYAHSNEDGRCTGKNPCPTCTNCSRCAYCSNGGTCGACAGGLRTIETPSGTTGTAALTATTAPLLTRADSLKKGLDAKTPQELVAEIYSTHEMAPSELNLLSIKLQVGDKLVDCPPQGTTSDIKKQKAYIKKARYRTPLDVVPLEWTAVIGDTDDIPDGWEEGMAVEFTAYAVKIFLNTKGEGCNCSNSKVSYNTETDAYADTRIYLTLKCDESSDTSSYMLAEVSPRLKALKKSQGEDYSTSALKAKYQGHWVTVKGYLFYDFEHEDESTNNGYKYKTKSTNTNRITGWELHPLFHIELAEPDCP